MEIVDQILKDVKISNLFLVEVLTSTFGTSNQSANNLLKHNILNTDKGLTILKTTLPCLSDDELREKGSHYISLCIRHIKRPTSNDVLASAYSVLKVLFRRLRSLPDIEKIVTIQTFTDFFQSLNKNTPDCLECLECLEVIISEYPKQCLSHRTTIEKYIIKYLDCDIESLVVGAAKCCHILQQVRPSTEKTANPKSSWRMQHLQLCSASIKIVSKLFENSGNVYSNYLKNIEFEEFECSNVLSKALNQSAEPRPLIDLIEKNSQLYYLSPAEQITLLSQRLVNVHIFLQAMLVDPYPANKVIRTHYVLNIIMHFLNISFVKKSDEQISSFVLMTQIPKLKMAAMRTLEALIISLDSNLLPYSSLVLRILIQTLKWSKENKSLSVIELRKKIYNAVITWLKMVKCEKLNMDETAKEKYMLDVILDDITHHRSVVHLQLGQHSTKNLSKKAKKRLAKNSLQESTIANFTPGYKEKTEQGFLDVELAVSALKCLEYILLSSGRFMKPALHKRIQNIVIKQCFEQSKCSVESQFSAKHLLALFRVLEACRVSVPSNLAGPDQYCLYLYSSISNNDEELSLFCNSALQALRLSLQSVPASISFPPDFIEDEIESEENNKNVFSERNRAALQCHLGKERFEEIDLTNDTLLPNQNGKVEEFSSNESLHQNHIPTIHIEDANINTDVVDILSDDIELCEPEIKKHKSDYSDRGNNPFAIDIIIEEVETTSSINKQQKEIHDLETQLPNTESMMSKCPEITINGHESIPIDELQEGLVTQGEKLSQSPLTDSDDTDIPCGQIAKSPVIDSQQDTKVECKEQGTVALDVISIESTKLQEINDNETGGTHLTVEEMMADFVDSQVIKEQEI